MLEELSRNQKTQWVYWIFAIIGIHLAFRNKKHHNKFQPMHVHMQKNRWRVSYSGNGRWDPFGAIAFYGVIAQVMQGECYNWETPVEITAE